MLFQFVALGFKALMPVHLKVHMMETKKHSYNNEYNIELKSAQRDTNLRAGTLQPDRTF